MCLGWSKGWSSGPGAVREAHSRARGKQRHHRCSRRGRGDGGEICALCCRGNDGTEVYNSQEIGTSIRTYCMVVVILSFVFVFSENDNMCTEKRNNTCSYCSFAKINTWHKK